jgi:hypothetical protein
LAVSSFKDVNWSDNEYLATDKLNTMCANSRYLFERAPKLYYNSYGVKKDMGVRIACGTTTVPPKKGQHYYAKTVNFGAFFTAGCKPVVVTSTTTGGNRRMILTQWGIQGVGYVPDHRGFVAALATATLEKSHYLSKTMYVNWIAMGY